MRSGASFLLSRSLWSVCLVISASGQKIPDPPPIPSWISLSEHLPPVKHNIMSAPTENRNGINAFALAALGAGVAAAFGSMQDPSREGHLGSVGGALGAMVGALSERNAQVKTIIGAASGGFIGGGVGGLVGGVMGRGVNSLATIATTGGLGFVGLAVGSQTYGNKGGVIGGATGALVGYGLGKVILGPSSLFVVSGLFGAIGGGVGAYLGSTDLVDRPRSNS